MATSRTLRTRLKCMCHSPHIFRCSYSSRETRRLLVDNGCSSPELCNPIQYCLACRNLSIPPDVKMSKNTLHYSSGIIVFKKTFPQQTLDALPTNAAWWLKALNRSTQRCVSLHHLQRCRHCARCKSSNCFCPTLYKCVLSVLDECYCLTVIKQQWIWISSAMNLILLTSLQLLIERHSLAQNVFNIFKSD